MRPPGFAVKDSFLPPSGVSWGMLQDVWLAIDERRYGQAEALLGANDDLRVGRAGQMALGYIYAHTGRCGEARRVFGELREQHRGDDWEHIAVHQLGRVERLAGQPEAALKFFEEERALIRAQGEEAHKLAVNALETAQCFLKLGRLADARRELDLSVEAARTHDDPETLGRAERALADLSLSEGHPQAARLHYERALVAFRESEDEFAVRETEALLENV